VNNHVVYAIAAYVASVMLYVAYVAHLWSSERRLERGGRDFERR